MTDRSNKRVTSYLKGSVRAHVDGTYGDPRVRGAKKPGGFPRDRPLARRYKSELLYFAIREDGTANIAGPGLQGHNKGF